MNQESREMVKRTVCLGVTGCPSFCLVCLGVIGCPSFCLVCLAVIGCPSFVWFVSEFSK